ncbi:MAG TPA: CHASE domain-containing protein, partial [Pseudomonadales bacterium]|nr:CHASE domain-containing protein [Pseudomonadales bacterium]
FAKDREMYYPIFYIEPYKNHEELLGLDMASDTLWFASLQQVLDNKTPSLSKTKIIRSNSVDAPLALMIAPIFNTRVGFNGSPALRNPISGFIVAELHIDRLINKLLLNLRHDDVTMENFQIQLYEMNGDETQQLILTKTYTTTASTTDPGQHTGLQRFNKDFVFKNRLWHIAIMNNNPKEALDALIEATKIALFSVSIFTLLVMYSIRIIRSQHKIQKLMDQQTQILSDTQQKIINVMDCMSEGFICFNPDMKIRAVNQKAEQIFSYSHGEMTGLEITSLLPNLKQDFASIPVRMLSNKNSRQCMETLSQTGVLLTLSVAIIKADTSDTPLYFCIFEDISEKSREALVRTDALTKLSQEIKTPLTAINGAVDFIVSHQESDLSDQNQRMLAMIKHNNARLAELINELIHTLK